MPLTSLEVPCDFLVTGPPCPPWSGQGSKKGFKDARSRVFTKILRWLLYLIHAGGLLGCILENVTGLEYERDGRVSPKERFRASGKLTPITICRQASGTSAFGKLKGMTRWP